LGTWYTYANIFNSFALGKKCSKAVYRQALNESGFPIINRMTIENTNVNILIPSWKTEANGYAEPVDPVEAPNKLAAFIKPQLFGMEFDANEGKYWVTDTDYTSYSFVYSCREVFNFLFIVKEEYFWILTRSKNPSATQVSSFKNKLEGDLNWNEDLFFNIQDCDD